jgi:hypothetical protein
MLMFRSGESTWRQRESMVRIDVRVRSDDQRLLSHSSGHLLVWSFADTILGAQSERSKINT